MLQESLNLLSLDPSRDTLCALTANYNHLNTALGITLHGAFFYAAKLIEEIFYVGALCEISTLINSCFINNVEFEMAFDADISMASRYCQPFGL